MACPPDAPEIQPAATKAAASPATPMDKARRQGPCAFCGDPRASARHRLWDAVDVAFRVDRWSAKLIAADRALDVDEVRWVRKAYAAARAAHRPLPGRRVFA